jgi:hypothetical protein
VEIRTYQTFLNDIKQFGFILRFWISIRLFCQLMNTSSLAILALMVLVGVPVQGQNTTQLPADAIKLRKSYLDAREKALKPLNGKYISELQRLLAAHTKTGNLSGALAIQAEIEQLKEPEIESSTPLPALAGKTGTSKKMYRHLAGSTWSIPKEDQTVVLEPDGTMRFSKSIQKPLTWSVSDKGELMILESGAGTPRNAGLSPREDRFHVPYSSGKECVRIETPTAP